MPRARFALSLAVVFALALLALRVHAQLQTINPPGGGRIVYGSVNGEQTEAGAMAAILRSVHQSLGERPQVGRLFQSRGSQSVAVFFTVTRHDQGAGKPPLKVAGEIIAVKVNSQQVQAALLSDDAARFSRTLGPMSKTLFSQWHPFAGAAESGGAQGSSASLHQHVATDRSAAIGLPDGWHARPNQDAGGTIVADGPNGEIAAMGVALLATDLRNPHAQATYRAVQSGQLANTAYARSFYYPWGQNPSGAFVGVVNHARQLNGLRPLDTRVNSVRPSGPGCARIDGNSDFQDGKGERQFITLFCEGQPGPASGVYMDVMYTVSAPMAIFPRQQPTLNAILASYQINQQVMSREIAAIAAPAIAQIHAIGQAAEARINAAHQAMDIHNSSLYEHWDSMDRRSQEFENYQLGYSVVRTTDPEAHATLWNEDANYLVQHYPDKFEFVNAPNYWKGVDY